VKHLSSQRSCILYTATVQALDLRFLHQRLFAHGNDDVDPLDTDSKIGLAMSSKS
jgi:hypothetical protein